MNTSIIDESFISFIIPALNEEKNIARTIKSIKRNMEKYNYEIIVADNGSSDRTIEISQALGASVIVDQESFIGGLRNTGVSISKGSILVFIDSDIELDKFWIEELITASKNWPKDGLIVTGSTYTSPSNSSFIERNWFSKFSRSDVSYINSGHLITTKKMFTELGGFDSKLKTAEDYDFSQRAKRAGGVVVFEPNLKAYHHGFPSTIKDFIVREAWHGREDLTSVRKFIKSKTAIASLINSALIIVSILSLLTAKNLAFSISAFSLSVLSCSFFCYLKFGTDNLLPFIRTTLCFELYLIGRTCSIFLGSNRPNART